MTSAKEIVLIEATTIAACTCERYQHLLNLIYSRTVTTDNHDLVCVVSFCGFECGWDLVEDSC